jgi:DNA-binding MarR family transcriptional regulator
MTNIGDLERITELFRRFVKIHQKQEGFWNTQMKDLSGIELSVLNLIENAVDIQVKDIKNSLGVAGSTLTKVIDRLESKLLITRTICIKDRRSFSLKLTEEGFQIQQKHKLYETRFCEAILESLDTGEERHLFLKMLTKIADRISRKGLNELLDKNE